MKNRKQLFQSIALSAIISLFAVILFVANALVNAYADVHPILSGAFFAVVFVLFAICAIVIKNNSSNKKKRLPPPDMAKVPELKLIASVSDGIVLPELNKITTGYSSPLLL